MAPRNDNFAALVGNTPLLELGRFAEELKLGARILAKIEYLNPAGSIKDRTAWGLIRDAEESGQLKPGQQIVDITSGNTGIGLAALAAARGYPAARRGSHILIIGNELVRRGAHARLCRTLHRRHRDAGKRQALAAMART